MRGFAAPCLCREFSLVKRRFMLKIRPKIVTMSQTAPLAPKSLVRQKVALKANFFFRV